MLCIDNPTLMFTTAFYGILNTNTGELHYGNAGHNPPYVLRKSGAIDTLTGLGGMALGIMEDFNYPTQRCQLAPGELLVCFSDGVTEATDAGGNLFGEERLDRFVREASERPSDRTLRSSSSRKSTLIWRSRPWRMM